MSRLNLILISIAVSCLFLWYLLFVRPFGLSVSDQSVTTEEDTPLVLDLGAKKRSKNSVRVDIIDPPDNGILKHQLDRTTFVPRKDYFGVDRFQYRLVSGQRISDSAEVSITITPVNDRPLANDLHVQGEEDKPISIVLDGYDTDGDGLEYQIVNQPRHGRLSGTGKHLVYQGEENYTGIDRFTYRALDEHYESLTAAVSISIDPVNDVPSARNQILSTFENMPIELAFEGEDPDSSDLAYKIVSNPENGVITQKGQTCIYHPKRRFVGTDRLLYVVRDETSISQRAEIRIEVKKIDRNTHLKQILTRYLKDGGIAIGDPQHPEYLVHEGQYVPASILKIVTASAALYHLGKNYRYKTEIYLDRDQNLYIKGYGDPSLSSSDWYDIAGILYSRGIFAQDLNSLIIDTTAFASDLKVDGRRDSIHYYDSPPSALASNGNTVALRIMADGSIEMEDDYTPLTPMVEKIARQLPRGYQRFNVASDARESIRYTAEMVEIIFGEYGAFFSDTVLGGRVPRGLKPMLVHRSSQRLIDIVKEMLAESNNYTANQLLLTLAYKRKGEGADIATGAAVLTSFLRKEIGLHKSDFRVVEGSGLSTKNSIDLLAMLKILNYFSEYRELLPDLRMSKYADLSRTGRRWTIVAKSGTLNHTANLAGFLQIDQNVWKPFVIMLNDDIKTRGTVMEIIAKYYNS